MNLIDLYEWPYRSMSSPFFLAIKTLWIKIVDYSLNDELSDVLYDDYMMWLIRNIEQFKNCWFNEHSLKTIFWMLSFGSNQTKKFILNDYSLSILYMVKYDQKGLIHQLNL